MYFMFLKGFTKCIKCVNVRLYSVNTLLKCHEIDRLRNVGILAHIDAGKTTTTERMLYYSGLIKHMGEVHHGNTVTDYMAQERERGITIKSAAVTFIWKNHQFNLIDTPGHIDFTMEVEQTLNVLDGAIVTLDASAGVEAQTLTVWNQADQYNVPRIIFVNKMDRIDANLKLCCESVKKKLGMPTMCLHIPIVKNNIFLGVVDIVTLEKLTWDVRAKNKLFLKEKLSENSDPEMWKIAVTEQSKLIDDLSNYDNKLANVIIETESLSNINSSHVVDALRRVTLEKKAVPVVCGSAYKNVGIEPLMDAVVLYLPSPVQRSLPYKYFQDKLCARAFKIIHDKQRGALTFFRIYSGKFTRGQKIYNIHKSVTEQTGKLLIAFADEFREVDELVNGNIAVVTGLKQTVCGDLITNSANVVHLAKEQMLKENNSEITNILETTRKIPEAVFFCSVEPPSLSSLACLELSLSELQREDPSLKVTHDQDTGQIVLGGMGELHLEIIKDRILKEYKLSVDLGPLQIAYREAPLERVSCDLTTETKIGSTKHSVFVSLSLIPVDQEKYDEKGILVLDRRKEYASNIANIFHKHLAAVRQGLQASLMHGPKICSQVINVNVMLHMLEVAKGTSDSVIVATASQCVQKLLKQSGTYILEPVMWLEIVCPEEYVSTVLADLSRRRVSVQNINMRRSNKVISADAPLAELMGYSTILRTLSSGTATFSMEFLEYRKMSPVEETKAIESTRGF